MHVSGPLHGIPHFRILAHAEHREKPDQDPGKSTLLDLDRPGSTLTTSCDWTPSCLDPPSTILFEPLREKSHEVAPRGCSAGQTIGVKRCPKLIRCRQALKLLST